MYNRGEIDFMSEDDYVRTVCDFWISSSSYDNHRLAGNGLKSELIAQNGSGQNLTV